MPYGPNLDSMKKMCLACGQPVADEARQFCPKCDKLELSTKRLTTEELQQVARTVLESLKGDWKFKAEIFGAVLLVVLAVIGVIDAIVGFNLKENMADHFRNQEKDAKQRIDGHLASLDDDVKESLAQIDFQMRSNVARNFETPAIRATIENVAKDEAKGILEAEVRPAVDGFRDDALFIRTIARAQAYDFKAYQRLLEVGGQTNDNAKLAKQAVAGIDRSLERDRSDDASFPRVFMTIFGTNLYTGPFASDELAMLFSKMNREQTSLNREGFVNSVRDLKQPLFLPSLMELFTNESDLAVADRLTIAISDSAEKNFRPHDFELITTWWNDHRDSYSNWPFSALNLGLDEFAAVRYARAAEAFEQVLKLDSGADMSRAHAIVCYWETGQTNRATMLAKEFKQPSIRWAQWAAAKAELDAGDVSNATVHFFRITTNFPGMWRKPDPRLHVYRKIDWQLFNRLEANAKH